MDEVEEFMEYLKVERHYTEDTQHAYREDLDDFTQCLKASGHFSTFEKVDRLDVETYLSDLADRKLARSSVARKMSSMRSFYRYLIRVARPRSIRLSWSKPRSRTTTCQVFFLRAGDSRTVHHNRRRQAAGPAQRRAAGGAVRHRHSGVRVREPDAAADRFRLGSHADSWQGQQGPLRAVR